MSNSLLPWQLPFVATYSGQQIIHCPFVVKPCFSFVISTGILCTHATLLQFISNSSLKLLARIIFMLYTACHLFDSTITGVVSEQQLSHKCAVISVESSFFEVLSLSLLYICPFVFLFPCWRTQFNSSLGLPLIQKSFSVQLLWFSSATLLVSSLKGSYFVYAIESTVMSH